VFSTPNTAAAASSVQKFVTVTLCSSTVTIPRISALVSHEIASRNASGVSCLVTTTVRAIFACLQS
jgi:hypothetical protein